MTIDANVTGMGLCSLVIGRPRANRLHRIRFSYTARDAATSPLMQCPQLAILWECGHRPDQCEVREMRKRLMCVLIGGAVSLLGGCKSLIIHRPDPDGIANPIQKIEEVLFRQPYKVRNLEVTNNFFRLTTEGGWFNKTAILYFAYVYSHRIFERNNWYYVDLLGEHGEVKCRVVAGNEQLAREFVDAVYAMIPGG